jgi:hypothetical protein
MTCTEVERDLFDPWNFYNSDKDVSSGPLCLRATVSTLKRKEEIMNIRRRSLEYVASV